MVEETKKMVAVGGRPRRRRRRKREGSISANSRLTKLGGSAGDTLKPQTDSIMMIMILVLLLVLLVLVLVLGVISNNTSRTS
jgi:heme/copper-type cytochrome/quinol oxidase subunit 2